MQDDKANRYLVIGHVTKDQLSDGSHTIGGTVTYAAAAARRLGWQPIVITACASSFVVPPELADIDRGIVASANTTTFRNEYGPCGRTQIVDAVASPINVEQILAHRREATLVHLGPVARELDPSVAASLAGSFLVATLQGWLRTWSDSGVVSFDPRPEVERFLPLLRAAVVSIEDIQGDWSLAERWSALTPVLVVTQDRNGCTVYHEGRRTWIAPRRTREVDATGAGDVFATFFFVRLWETGDVEASAQFANVAASISVEDIGVYGIPGRAEVEQSIHGDARPMSPAFSSV